MPRARLVVRPGGSQARTLATTDGTVSHANAAACPWVMFGGF